MKSGSKCLLWSSCASHLGADYYFFSAHVGMCMHKVAAGWEVGPMEGVGGGGIWGAWSLSQPLAFLALAFRDTADCTLFNPPSVDLAPVYSGTMWEKGARK